MATYNYTQAHTKIPAHYHQNPQNPPQQDFQYENFKAPPSPPAHHEFSQLTTSNEKLKLENYHLRNLHSEIESKNLQIQEKLDRSDKYWLQRVKNLEDSLTSERDSCNRLTHTAKTQESSLQNFEKKILLLTRDKENLNSCGVKTETK
jgi:hypothetical protein